MKKSNVSFSGQKCELFLIYQITTLKMFNALTLISESMQLVSIKNYFSVI